MRTLLPCLGLLVLFSCDTGDGGKQTETGRVSTDSGDAPRDTGNQGSRDRDGDGYTEDCDDDNPAVHPGAAEYCDGLDNDCNEVIDDNAIDATDWYADTDGDGYGDAEEETLACDAPVGHVSNDEDCDDNDARFNPSAIESDCEDENDYNCDGSVGWEDSDSDGFAACADCDDSDADVNDDAVESCNDVDDDCDGLTDEDDPDLADGAIFYGDSDGDGHGGQQYEAIGCDAPAGYVDNNDDCDDLEALTYPSAAEICDDEDNDCDGDIDEGVGLTWYADVDGDGYGDASSTVTSCDAPQGYSSNGNDCNDSAPSANPGGVEVCNGLDDDCDGTIDGPNALNAATFYTDSDGDGYGDASSAVTDCEAPANHVTDNSDCDDTSASNNPAASEVCDGADNNCDGSVDEATATDASTWYPDLDGDSFGSSNNPEQACSAPGGFVADNTDCNDVDASINPSGTEVCDSADTDEDCDGAADDNDPEGAGGTTLYFPDADGDGYGDQSNAGTGFCDDAGSLVNDNSDCNDSESTINPAATDTWYDGVDSDCNGASDYDADGDGFDSEDYSGTDCNDTNASVNSGCYLYTFTIHDFTTCGVSGRDGPSLSQCASAYSTTEAWDEDTAYLNMTTQGIQRWTVPATGTYRISATGAAGQTNSNSYTGGTGATLQGEFDLTQGDVLRILVGQMGTSNTTHGNENGGGGGSFVVDDATETPLVVAGGGGGAPSHSYSSGCTRTNGDAQLGQTGKTVNCQGTGAGGTGGNGGSTSGDSPGGAGGGFYSNGANGNGHCSSAGGGYAFINGGVGGTTGSCYGTAHGGFGGGGSGDLAAPGGGGGYSGGGAAGNWSSSADYGGGGGSYNDGTNQVNTADTNTGDGIVTISLLNLN